MGDVGGDGGGAAVLEGAGRVAQRAGGIDHVVDHDAVLALDLADDVHHFGLVGPVASFVDDGKIRVTEALRQGPGANDAAHVG